jgi:hypothetical protein
MPVALTSTQVVNQYSESGPDLFAVFWLRNVNTNDTVDLATIGGGPLFQVISQAAVMSPRYAIATLAAFQGTVVTMPAGLTKGSGYLIVSGC